MTANTSLALARMAIGGLSRKDRVALMADLIPKSAQAPSESRILRRREVARRFGVSVRAIDNWARQGILERVKLPGRARAVGFRLADVERLIAGPGPT